MCVAASGYALSEGEFVYTPQGRFQITGANVNANSAFQDWTGWTVYAGAEGVTLGDKFNNNANGYAEGINSVQSVDATAGEGMYFKFEPSDAAGSYVVSFKMKGAPLDVVKWRIPGDGTKPENNMVIVGGSTDPTYTYPIVKAEDGSSVVVNIGEELTDQWQTFNYAIVGDGTSRTYFISFTGMATTIEIADLQIAPALQFADLRQRDAMVEKIKTYVDCYPWAEGVLEEYAVTEILEALQAVGDESGQDELNELLETANEIMEEFFDKCMDDYLSSDPDNYFSTWRVKIQKVAKIGDWTILPDGRGFWENESSIAPDLGHYAGNSGWSYGAVNDPMGAYQQQTLDPGSYVFSIESTAALREESTSSSWTINEGWNPAYGVAYIVKVNEGAEPDTIAAVTKDLDALDFTPFYVVAQITESANYEIGFKAYCKDGYKDLKNGSVVYVKDARFYSKNDNKYNKREMTYEANVRTQITTGRENLTTAAGYLADETYLWGKAALKECADSIETKIAYYETLSQDDIIATYDRDVYVNTTSDSTGLLQYEVYQQATKYIIAANKEFLAENDTLNSMQAIIDNAEITLALRIYDTATGKEALRAAIDKAKDIQAQMKASQYSVENAAAIVAANAELNEAISLFTTTIPAANIATIVDIDFEQAADLDIETFLYQIPGAKGSMLLSTFSEQAASNQEFEKGFWANGEHLWSGYLRVGNGTGTVTFDPTENGSMGTNILKVACDFYVQGLSGRSLGFYLKDEADQDIFGIYRNFYDNTTTTNTCDADLTMIWAKSGSNYNNASPADATDSITPNYALEKSHIEVIMDYGKKTQYCTISSPNGSTTSAEVALEAIPVKYVLQCNYNNNDRRAWFDNLKIERVTAGEYIPSGVETVKTNAKANDGAIYNLAGQRLSTAPEKGVYIQNGKKFVVK